jgi:hypothetical protein
MIRISSQNEMQVACRAVRFCYLCGEPLPARNQQDRKLVCREHVIPKTLLGDPPLDRVQRWPVKLDVHKGCDKKYKAGTDDLAALLHCINVHPKEQWPKPKHIQRLGLSLVRVHSLLGGPSLPAFGNAQKPVSAVWMWVRGIHAALYREYLPESAPHTILAPVPGFNASAGPSALRQTVERSAIVRAPVEYGVRTGRADGLSAWGGQVSYECVWFPPVDEHCGDVWACFWGLIFPGVSTWSRTVLPPGQECPWHGLYTTNCLPDGATVLELPKARLRVEPL